MKLTAQDITLNEMVDIEDELGRPLAEAMQEGSMKAARLVAWILRRRDDPTLTLEQAGEMTVGDLEAMGPQGETPGEAPGGGNGLSPPASPAPGLSTPSRL